MGRRMSWARAIALVVGLVLFCEYLRERSGTPTASGTSAVLRGKVSPKPARVAEATPPHVVATERPVKIAVAIVLTNEAKTDDARQLLADGAAVLAESVRLTKSKFTIEFVAIVHPSVTHSRVLLEKVESPHRNPAVGATVPPSKALTYGCCHSTSLGTLC
eukprot:m.169288 g.169288  ORF g.169288 m.169288 type:complete len:161 (-) comp24160_c0_seq3:945-1427(-)